VEGCIIENLQVSQLQHLAITELLLWPGCWNKSFWEFPKHLRKQIGCTVSVDIY